MSDETLGNRGEPTDDEVLQSVDKTGFLLERQAHGALQRHGFNASIGVAYSDPETEGHREIDVMGVMSATMPNKAIVFMHVLIECKKWASGPLVGIGGPPTDSDRRKKPSEFRIKEDPVQESTKHSRPDTFYRRYRLNASTHPLRNAEILATQLVLMERTKTWMAKNTGIYDSIIIPLVKAQTEYADVFGLLDMPGVFGISITRSALVTTAPLRAVLWAEGKDTEVLHPKYFPVTRSFSTESMPHNFTFEVVSADHLDTWLSEEVVPYFKDTCAAIEEWWDDQEYGNS